MFFVSFLFQFLLSTTLNSQQRIVSLNMNTLDGIVLKGDLKPLSNNILVKVMEPPSKSSGGIFIPETSKVRPTEGKVVAAGKTKFHPISGVKLQIGVSVGDSVMYGKYEGTELKYNNQNHQLIKDDDVLLTYHGDVLNLASLKCAQDNVLIKLPAKDEVLGSGIIISTASNGPKRADYGIIVRVGSGKYDSQGKLVPQEVEVGDSVRFRDYVGTEVQIEGKSYIVVKSSDILAKW
jgi:chaperonin GroES